MEIHSHTHTQRNRGRRDFISPNTFSSTGKAKGPAKRHSASRGKKLGEDVKTWTETDKAPGNQSGTSPASNARRMLNPMGGMADVTNQLKMQLGKKPNGPMPGRNSDSPHNGGAQPAGMPQRGMPQRGMPQRPMPQGKPSGSQQPSQMPPQQPIKLPQMPMPGQQQQQQQQQPIKLPMPQQGRGVQQHPMHAQHAANLPKNEQGLGNPPSSQGNKSVGIPHPSTPIPGRVDVSSGGRAAKSAGIPHPSTPMPGREQGKPSQPQQQPQQRAPSGLSQQQNEKYNRLLALLNEKVLTAKLEGPVAQEFKTVFYLLFFNSTFFFLFIILSFFLLLYINFCLTIICIIISFFFYLFF